MLNYPLLQLVNFYDLCNMTSFTVLEEFWHSKTSFKVSFTKHVRSSEI